MLINLDTALIFIIMATWTLIFMPVQDFSPTIIFHKQVGLFVPGLVKTLGFLEKK